MRLHPNWRRIAGPLLLAFGLFMIFFANTMMGLVDKHGEGVGGGSFDLWHGVLVIAAISSTLGSWWTYKSLHDDHTR